jgi:hypothetical protein
VPLIDGRLMCQLVMLVMFRDCRLFGLKSEKAEKVSSACMAEVVLNTDNSSSLEAWRVIDMQLKGPVYCLGFQY